MHNIPPKSEIMRRGGHKCRKLEMNLQLREQLKTISYTYRLLSQNFRITATQNLQLQTKKSQLKYNTKDSHETRRGENKRRRKEKRATKTNPKQLIKWK